MTLSSVIDQACIELVSNKSPAIKPYSFSFRRKKSNQTSHIYSAVQRRIHGLKSGGTTYIGGLWALPQWGLGALPLVGGQGGEAP
jgi:hypothetical protein